MLQSEKGLPSSIGEPRTFGVLHRELEYGSLLRINEPQPFIAEAYHPLPIEGVEGLQIERAWAGITGNLADETGRSERKFFPDLPCIFSGLRYLIKGFMHDGIDAGAL